MSLTSTIVTKLNRMNRAAQDAVLGRRVRQYKISQTVTRAQFTDGGSTSGTFVLTDGTIPVGATVLFSAVEAITGFTGNTSAVILIGDGSDADRYSTGTPNVFVTAAGGVSVGAPSGVQYHDVGKSITLTITSATDFTNVTAGSVTVSVYYLD